MRYYSTNNQKITASIQEAVIQGLAQDNGLFMPERIVPLDDHFFDTIELLSFQEIAFEVSKKLFGEDIPHQELQKIVYDTLSFDVPLVGVEKNIYSLELFHGPTLAFKDVGARFMSRLLAYFVNKETDRKSINVLVATSGDTGSAVANGFLSTEGVKVHVLYPKGMVSEIQEKQFTTLGENISAIAIDGTFDDCQRLVKTAFLDKSLNEKHHLTSANSINIARFLPQSFYYFYAFAQLKAIRSKLTSEALEMVVSVPSGNLGNITAGLIAQRMGLPIKRFIASNNRNDIFLQYLNTGKYTPRPSVSTIANAMDVGDPSNFVRILDLFDHKHSEITKTITGFAYDDNQIADTINHCLAENNYLLDPHGACAYQSLKESLNRDENGVFLETAHPAKFVSTVEKIIDQKVEIPDKLQAFMNRERVISELSSEYSNFKDYLLGLDE